MKREIYSERAVRILERAKEASAELSSVTTNIERLIMKMQRDPTVTTKSARDSVTRAFELSAEIGAYFDVLQDERNAAHRRSRFELVTCPKEQA